MRYLTEDHSLYNKDVIDDLVEEYNYNNMTLLFEISDMFEGVERVTNTEMDAASPNQKLIESAYPSQNPSLIPFHHNHHPMN
ncbi:hypothetical protein CR513_40255, partial [Mucuna pruriens]